LTLVIPLARHWGRNRLREFVYQAAISLAGWMATTDNHGSLEIMRRAADPKADALALAAELS
jgi:hypothetical protein